jgi:hypothetical protein
VADRRALFAALFLTAVGLTGGCGQVQAGCSLAGSDITCHGETFDDCALEGCPISNIGCSNPGHGCQIAPGMVLEYFQEKEPMPYYLCGDPLLMCGMWAEASCQVTVTLTSGGSIAYALHDPTCP